MIYIIITILSLWNSIAPAPSLDYVEKIANEVFTDLWNEIEANQETLRLPKLIIVNSKEQGAYYIPGNYRNGPEIYLEYEAYKICQSFGNDSLTALAALLAHELAHYTLGHKPNGLVFFEKNNELVNKRKKQEIEADSSGIILATLAGYPVHEIYDDLLSTICETYTRCEAKPYPSLEERKQISYEAKKRAKKIIFLFDMGNAFSLFKEWDLAINCYEEIVFHEKYTGKEIYRNLGLAYLFKILNDSAYNDRFIYPLWFDESFSWQRTYKREPVITDSLRIETYFEKADIALKKVSRWDKDKKSLISLSILGVMKGYFLHNNLLIEEAIIGAKKLNFNSYKSTQKDSTFIFTAEMIIALGNYHLKKVDKAKNLLHSLRQHASPGETYLIDYNLSVIDINYRKPKSLTCDDSRNKDACNLPINPDLFKYKDIRLGAKKEYLYYLENSGANPNSKWALFRESSLYRPCYYIRWAKGEDICIWPRMPIPYDSEISAYTENCGPYNILKSKDGEWWIFDNLKAALKINNGKVKGYVFLYRY